MTSPTLLDVMNAFQYADDVIAKEMCLAQPLKYKWIPDRTTSYPCPDGLVCESGTCVFTESGCNTISETPYYDCTRKTQSCSEDTGGDCTVCDYSISDFTTISGALAPLSENPLPGCRAGDRKYAEYTPYPYPEGPDVYCTADAECAAYPDTHCFNNACVYVCEQDTDCPTTMVCGQDAVHRDLLNHCYVPVVEPEKDDDLACPSKPVQLPAYTVLQYANPNDVATIPIACLHNFDATGATRFVACTTSEDCAAGELCCDRGGYCYNPKPDVVVDRVACRDDIDCFMPPGVGGLCERDPRSSNYGFCVDPANMPRPYLEWRRSFQMYDNVYPAQNVCVETIPAARQWCEMPWTRPGMSPTFTEDMKLDLQSRVKNAWKTKARLPFYYNSSDGTCHVTNTYCSANLKNGGFSSKYGTSKNYYIMGNVCDNTTSTEINPDMDCCFSVGDAIGQFFLGRTITTDLRELITGDTEGFGTRWSDYLKRGSTVLEPYMNFVCDVGLKDNVYVIGEAAPGVRTYAWTWNERATQLFGLVGVATGLLTRECPQSNVYVDVYGVEHLVLPHTHPWTKLIRNNLV